MKKTYPLLTKTPNVVVDDMPYAKISPVLKALQAFCVSEKRLSKDKQEAENRRLALERALDKCFGNAEVCLRTELPERFGKEYDVADGGYLLLRTKAVMRRVLDRDSLKMLLGPRFDLCFHNQEARGSIQSGSTIQLIMDKTAERPQGGRCKM